MNDVTEPDELQEKTEVSGPPADMPSGRPEPIDKDARPAGHRFQSFTPPEIGVAVNPATPSAPKPRGSIFQRHRAVFVAIALAASTGAFVAAMLKVRVLEEALGKAAASSSVAPAATASTAPVSAQPLAAEPNAVQPAASSSAAVVADPAPAEDVRTVGPSAKPPAPAGSKPPRMSPATATVQPIVPDQPPF